MAILSLAEGTASLALPIIFGSILILTASIYYLLHQPPFPPNAPPLTKVSWPLLGSMDFFFKRWDFYQKAMAASPTGNFSFWAGQHPVVGISGEGSRHVFFESKGLAFAEGYATMLQGAPEVRADNNLLSETVAEGDGSFGRYFAARLTTLLKGPILKKGLPQLREDAKAAMEKLEKDPTKFSDPFDVIYRMVFQFTMRTVGATEIASDPEKLAKCLQLFNTVESAVSQWTIAYPWLPLPSKLTRFYGGARLYIMFKNIIDERNRQGIKKDDAMQYLMDQGDTVKDILQFVMGALFAGQLNTGVNAAWILCYLANNSEWSKRVRDEVNQVADKYSEADAAIPLKEKIMKIPSEAWESEFLMIDFCLKETIRIQMAGAGFRKNTSGKDIPLPTGEVIPSGAFVALAVPEVHLNPKVYSEPLEFDPSRYLPERQEDKSEFAAWWGWGVARHPCLGMRFAKLEVNLLVAFFTAYFDDVRLADTAGNEVGRLPKMDFNAHTARCPSREVGLKYRVRAEK